jgi:hypothetical protein
MLVLLDHRRQKRPRLVEPAGSEEHPLAVLGEAPRPVPAEILLDLLDDAEQPPCLGVVAPQEGQNRLTLDQLGPDRRPDA